MRTKLKVFYILMALALAIGLVGMQPVQPVEAGTQALRISQAYGGGGNSGATYTHDFIELFNSTNAAVNLQGWSVQYASATGTSWQVTELTGSIPANSYYLIQEAQGNGGTTPLPTPDATGTIPMGGTNFKVALVSSTTPLTGACPTVGVVDFLGTATANCYEGTAGAPSASNTTSVQRKSNGCQDTDQNGDDFKAAPPVPRNTATTPNQCSPATGPSIALIVPANGATAPKDSNITITFSEDVTVTNGWYDITCSVSGNHTAVVTDTNPVYTLNPNADFETGESCTVTIDKDLVVNAANQTMAADFVSTFNIVPGCGDPYTHIYDIQGSGDASPLAGQTVTTEGVVTANFQVGGKNGYFIQDPVGDGNNATSDGIFVFSTNPTVNVGDALRITGKVSENYNLTQLTPTNSTTVLTCGTGQTIAPLELTLPTTAPRTYEAYEGMLVTFQQELYISEYFNYDRYGEIVLASSRHFSPTHSNEPGAEASAAELSYQLDLIKVDDGLGTQNPSYLRHPDGTQFTKDHYFRGGDTVTGLTGIMDYNFNEYKIQPVGTATYTALNERPAAPTLVAGEIRIASLNVLNYFVTIDNAGSICGPAGNMECRGADTAEEFARQRNKVIAAILGMEADVIGLIEIENEHPGIAADAAVIDIVAGLNAATAPDTYAYVATGNIGTDAIKQAFIYKPAKVDQVGAFAILDENFDPAYDTTRNRPSLAVSFKDKITNEIFTVSVNHLKSKGSACAGDPDLGDGQGNCNLTRTAAAEVLVNWLETDPTSAESGMYVIIGDLNSYAKEDPIDAIKLGADGIADTADDVINLVERFRGDNAYGYVYDGRTGYLDHALANKKFASYVLDANFWNINADESDVFDYDMTFKPVAQEELYNPDAYRSSDHDPVLISLLLNHEPTAVDDTYTTNQGVALDIPAPGVLANDTDPNIYDNITASLVTGSGPANGTLEFNEDGSFVYTPNPGFSGTDSFQYTMHATPGLMAEYSDIATVTITVIDTTAPEIVSVTAIGAEGFADVLADDGVITVDQGYTVARTEIVLNEAVTVEAGTVVSVGGQPYGTITAEGNKLIVTPYPGNETASQIGTFVFSVPDGSVTDLAGNALVELSVTLIVNNVAPVAVNDAYTVAEDGTLTVEARGVLINDTDYNPNILTAIKVSDPANGTLILNADGSFVYTPTVNFNGTDSFTYKANDGELDSNVATVTIIVTPVNDMPAAEDIEVTTSEDTAISITLLGSDVDGDTLTYEIVAEPTNGTITVVGNVATYTPSQNYNGTDIFTYKANDGELDSNVATVTITVTPVNDMPAAEDIEVTTPEDTAINITLLGSDVDGDMLTYEIVAEPTNGTITVVGNIATYTPSQNYNGTDSFTYKANDGEIDSNVATVTITVTPVNDAPVLDEIADVTIPERQLFTFTATATDVDDTQLTFSLITPPEGAAIDPETGEFTWTPTHEQVGAHEITLCVSDGELEACQNFTITVFPVNTAPVAVEDEYTLNQDETFNVEAPGVLENDSDPENDALTAVLVVSTQHGTLTLNADGSLTYVPDAGFYGEDSFTYKAFDGEYYSEEVTVTLTIVRRPVWNIYLPIIMK